MLVKIDKETDKALTYLYIAGRAKAIKDSIDTYSQFCWGIAEEMRDDFELLNKLEELCGEEG